jgi:hypothetical protein
MNSVLRPDLDFDIRNKISLFCASIPVFGIPMFLLFRAGFEEKFYIELITCLGFSFFFLFVPLAISRYKHGGKSEVVVLVISLFAVSVFSFPILRYLVCVAGLGCYINCLSIFLKTKRSMLKALGVFIVILYFIVWVVFTVWGGARPTLYESLSVSREVFQVQDLFFHCSIAQMIKHYGVPSTGLQGTPLIYYHYGSHWFFAQMSKLTDMSVVKIYTLFYPFVVVPLFFKTFLTFVMQIEQRIAGQGRLSALSVIFLFCLFLGIPPHLYAKGFVGTSILILESLVLSMILMFCLFSLWLSWSDKEKKTIELLQQHWPRWLVVTPCLLCLIGMIKISTLFVVMGIFFFVIIRLKIWKSMAGISFIVSAFGAILVYVLTVETLPFGLRQYGAEGAVEPGNFYTTMKTSGIFKPIDWCMFFGWTISVIALYWYVRVKTNLVQSLDIQQLKIVSQVTVVAALVGLLPSFVFKFSNANAVFFVTIQMFLSGAVLIAIAPVIQRIVDHKKILSIAYKISIVVIIGLIHYRVYAAFREIALEGINTRFKIIGRSDLVRKKLSVQDLPLIVNGFPDLKNKIKEQPLFRVLQQIETLDENNADRLHTLLLIEDYKNGGKIEGTADLNCLEKTFMIPALSGYALANGALYNCSIENYGESYYKYPGKDEDFTVSTLCEQYRKAGFITFYSYDVRTNRMNIYHCP